MSYAVGSYRKEDKRLISYILAVVSGVLFLAGDQLTKWLVVHQLPLNGSAEFLPGFLEFWYIHNEGGAWGFLEGYTWILLSITIMIMLVCVAMLLKFGVRNKTLFWAVTLVLSGGLGNMIDRIFRGGKVVDFLHFQFIDFPVFNVADCAVVLGAALMIFYFVRDMINEYRQKTQ